jgi:hypothetical protein
MPLLRKLFGGESGQKKDLTAKEGYALALGALREAYPEEAEGARLCCIYTSVVDSDMLLERDGACKGWHFDFFLPASQNLILVRVKNGKTRAKEISWQKTAKAPIEYVYAMYGAESESGAHSEPARLPDDWLDSPALVESIHKALDPHRNPKSVEELAPVALCLPAESLRYLQEEKVQEELSFPSAPQDCFAAICTSDEMYDEDCVLLYLEAATGAIAGEHIFRFPNMFYFGTSFNW